MKTVETPGVHPSQYGGGAPTHPHSVGHGTTRHGYKSSRGYSVTQLYQSHDSRGYSVTPTSHGTHDSGKYSVGLMMSRGTHCRGGYKAGPTLNGTRGGSGYNAAPIAWDPMVAIMEIINLNTITPHLIKPTCKIFCNKDPCWFIGYDPVCLLIKNDDFISLHHINL